jgi:hypothetical protein
VNELTLSEDPTVTQPVTRVAVSYKPWGEQFFPTGENRTSVHLARSFVAIRNEVSHLSNADVTVAKLSVTGVTVWRRWRLFYDWWSVSQSVCQSVCLGIEHPCGTCDQILLPVGMLLSEICSFVFKEAPSLTRGRVRSLQCNHSIVRVAQNPKLYFTVSSETPPTWRARLPYLYSPRNRLAQL